MTTLIRVLLVNHIELLCNVIAAVLDDEHDMKFVGCATSLDEAMKLAPESDVILVNTRMPDGAALRLVEAVTDADLPTKVVALGIAEMEAQIESSMAQATHSDYDEYLTDIRAKQEQAKARLAELEEADGGEWQEIRAELDKAVSEVQNAILVATADSK